ncbi:MAG: BamA/TamA family outer membrane protein [Candidatus Sericytochromatia bacterium]|nr:BamA/TamA family outer membrane protein [Candidatus Sericytochromatia bacterium]
MGNVNINGRTVDPRSIRQIPVPEGETPKSYVEKNQSLISKNFRDELYFEHEGQLFVTEDKFVVENIGIRKAQDAKVRVDAIPAIPILIDNEPDAHKVTGIEIQGAGPHQRWLEDNLKLKSGRAANLHDLQKEADRLFKSNRFLSVDFSPSATDKGIQLTLNVQPVPEKVQIHGLDPQRMQAMQDLFPKPLTRENIDKGLKALQSKMDQDSQVVVRQVQPHINGDSLDIYLDVSTLPSQLQVSGVPASEAETLKGFFQPPYNPASVDQGMEKLKAHYAERGQIVPQLTFTYGQNEAGEGVLSVDLRSTEMPQQLDFKGMTVYSPEVAQALFPKPLTMENIQSGMQALQQKYADDGYLLMPPEGVSADLKDGQLTINVREAKLSDIAFSGNDKTKSEVLQREMRLKADQPVNLKTLDDDLKRVSGTGLFANVQHSVEPDPEDPDKVRVRVHAAEDKASSFNVGAGYSLSNGPFGTASMNLGNMAGMNRRVSADVTLGTKVWGGGLNYYDPWAFDNRTSLGAGVYHRQWQGPYSDETRTGAKVTVGRPLGDIYDSPWRMDLTLDGQRVGIDPQYSVSGSGTDFRLGLKPTLTYNTLDNPSLPKEGMKWQTSAEPVWISGEAIGKLDSRFDYYRPLGSSERFTLHAGAQAGTSIGNTPLYEKFNNSGSGRTLLGWESDGSLVGSSYAIGTAGVNAEIWGPVSATARVTAGDFFDGTQFSPKVGAGVGVNVKLGNFGVLHAGYGHKLVGKQEGDKGGAFHIGFGIPF